jgi:hypothetical protein
VELDKGVYFIVPLVSFDDNGGDFAVLGEELSEVCFCLAGRGLLEGIVTVGSRLLT